MRLSAREAMIRRSLEGTLPVIPRELVDEAVRLGARRLRWRRRVTRLWWWTFSLGLTALIVWALITHPWAEPPSETTPPW